MAERKISLRDVRHHVKSLDQLVTDAWFDKSDGPTRISFADLRKHALGILEIVGNDSTSPHAATATKSPAAATDNDKTTAKERAAYQRAAADKAPTGLSAILGLSHIRKS